MKTTKYRFIDDLTSDVMFEAHGKTLEELFANAAEAMFSVICQLDRVEPKESRPVTAEAESAEKLVVAWLQKLIGMVDTDEMFFSRFEVRGVKKIKDHTPENVIWQVKANVYGEPITPEKGETVVKAVTNYGFRFGKDRKGKGYKVKVSLDI
jgi:SHS2 domain-containing protein